MKHVYFLRPIHSSDERFLSDLYASTRAEELAPLIDWTAQQKRDFLEQQFQAQHKYYQDTYKGAQFHVIEMESARIGRLYVDRREKEIRVIDIALLPEYRSKGIGRQLMTEVLKEGERSKKKVSIHVEHNNPAMRLYKRLGFEKIGDVGIYFLMEWLPESLKAEANSKKPG